MSAPEQGGLSEEERDDLCDAIMGYQHTMQAGAPQRFDKFIVPAVERILATRLAAVPAAEAGLRAAGEGLADLSAAARSFHQCERPDECGRRGWCGVPGLDAMREEDRVFVIAAVNLVRSLLAGRGGGDG